jgi:hypothetical protein
MIQSWTNATLKLIRPYALYQQKRARKATWKSRPLLKICAYSTMCVSKPTPPSSPAAPQPQLPYRAYRRRRLALQSDLLHRREEGTVVFVNAEMER